MHNVFRLVLKYKLFFGDLKLEPLMTLNKIVKITENTKIVKTLFCFSVKELHHKSNVITSGELDTIKFI